MRIYIISGGTIDSEVVRKAYAENKPDRIIAADSGLIFCGAHGIVPDIIVGDFDSLGASENIPLNAGAETAAEKSEKEKRAEKARSLLEKYRAEGVPVRRFRPEKDMTDTDIALEEAEADGADEVFFLGATGTRLDHTLSNILDLYKLRQKGIRGVILDAHDRITAPPGHRYVLRKTEQYGNYVSFFAPCGPVTGLTLTGFRYPAENASILPGDGGLFVSNELSAEEAEITWTEGALFIMETKD